MKDHAGVSTVGVPSESRSSDMLACTGVRRRAWTGRGPPLSVGVQAVKRKKVMSRDNRMSSTRLRCYNMPNQCSFLCIITDFIDGNAVACGHATIRMQHFCEFFARAETFFIAMILLRN
jgi:hypothetical protein